MSYTSASIKEQFKKVLKRRLVEPRVQSALLRGSLKSCYRIKLRTAGYRLVYQEQDGELIVLILAVGKRDKSQIYTEAQKRN